MSRRGRPLFTSWSLQSLYAVPPALFGEAPAQEGTASDWGRARCGHDSPCGCETAARHLGGPACCLRCPFEACVFDVLGGKRRAWTLKRAISVAKLRLAGMPPDGVAERLRMSRRSVFRLSAWLLREYGVSFGDAVLEHVAKGRLSRFVVDRRAYHVRKGVDGDGDEVDDDGVPDAAIRAGEPPAADAGEDREVVR